MGRAEAVLGGAEEGGARSFARRVAGVVRLEPDAWNEIVGDRDRAVLGQAALVAGAAAAANAVAAGSTGPSLVALESLASWLLLAGALWGAANGLGHRLGIGTALGVVGFAKAPLVLVALTAIPVVPLQAAIRLVALALFFAALVAGTRQALRVETMRAMFVWATAGLGTLFLVTLAMVLLSSA